jgi:hypothetical protein
MAGIPSVEAMTVAIFSYIQNLLIRNSKQECHYLDCEVHNIQTAPVFKVQSTPASIPQPELASEKQESRKI